MSPRVPLLLVPVVAALAACSGPTPPQATPGSAPAASARPSAAASRSIGSASPTASAVKASAGVPVKYVEITAAAGIHFKHENGATGKKFLPETMGAGAAFLDYDGDGRLDLFLVNSMPWPENSRGKLPTSALYRNLGGGKFEDVTEKVGLAVPMYGFGAAVGDYDNDGDPDLFVTCLGSDHLFRNDGGTFVDVSQSAGIADDDFGSSATWVDYDKDGRLDLLVGNYVKWAKESDIFCTLDGKHKSYCTPESYEGAKPKLWHNEGNGHFKDVAEAAGLLRAGDGHALVFKTLGVTVVDYDQDGWPDLVVANDTQPNYLFHNLGNGKFAEEGVASGIAFNENGVARGAMGIDAGDYDASGRPSLLIGNFSNEVKSLYHNEGHGLFVDAAPSANIAQASLLSLTFGCFFFDYDRDGFPDIFLANGHVEEEIEKVQSQVTWAQPPHLFRNLGGGRFEETTAAVGEALGERKVARGAAYGDIDGDGDLDLVVTTNGGPAHLYRNDGGNANHWLALLTVGTKSNRDGFGAVVNLTAGRHTQTAAVKAGMSYCSQSERAVSFGLGKTDHVDRVEIAWPSGRKDVFSDVPVDRRVVATEGGQLKVAETASVR